MEKPGTRVVICLATLTGLGAFFYVVQEKGFASEETAAFLQAILSGAAIMGAFYVARSDRQQARRDEAERQLRALIVTCATAFTFVETLASSLTIADANEDLSVTGPIVQDTITRHIAARTDELIPLAAVVHDRTLGVLSAARAFVGQLPTMRNFEILNTACRAIPELKEDLDRLKAHYRRAWN